MGSPCLRRRTLLLLVIGALASTASSADQSSKTTREDAPKNVLFIAVDDMRPSIGAFNFSLAHTPNIDSIAATGSWVGFLVSCCCHCISGLVATEGVVSDARDHSTV